MSEEPDQVVMFFWKRKGSPAVSAISNALRETISNTEHRFALAALMLSVLLIEDDHETNLREVHRNHKERGFSSSITNVP